MQTRQKLVLVLLLGTQFMLAIDFSILNVALPSIGHGVGIGDDHLQWVATAFALPAAGFTLLAGRVADLAGRRRMFMAGLVLLIAASVVGGLAHDPAVLLGARVGQGLAAAIATPAALSLLVTTFPEGPLRQRALGLNGALLSGGFTAGAIVGGLLTGFLSWRWAFLVNVPVALVILVAAPRLLTEARGTERARLDVPGALTVTGGLVALVYGIADGGNEGWGRPVVWAALAVGAALLVAFWRVELASPQPLVSLPVLRRRSVAFGNLGGFAIFGMETAVVFLLTLYLQQVLGYSATVTGLAFGIPGVAAVVAGIVGPRLMGRGGSERALVLGLFGQGLTTFGLVFIGPHRVSLVLILVVLAVSFFAHVYGIVAYMVTATSGLPDREQGLATALATMTQQVAITLGIPILSTVATIRRSALADDHTPAQALLGGIHLALLVDGAVVLLVAVVVAAGLRRRAVGGRSASAAEPERAAAPV